MPTPSNIPIYEVTFDKFDERDWMAGIYAIAVVENPAIGVDFIAMSKTQRERIGFSADSEKKILYGPALIPEQLIYRKQEMGEAGKEQEFYIKYSAETIERLAQHFLRMHSQQNINLEHDPSKTVMATVVESWIVQDNQNDKATSLGFCLPTGTWMVGMKIEEDWFWTDYVKQGKVKGFSIEGWLSMQQVMQRVTQSILDSKGGKPKKTETEMEQFAKKLSRIDKLTKELKGLLGLESPAEEPEEKDTAQSGAEGAVRQNDSHKPNAAMKGTKSNIKQTVAYKLQDGTNLVYDETTNIVSITDDTGAPIAIAPGGEYMLDNGQVMVIAEDGTLVEIRDAAAQSQQGADTAQTAEQQLAQASERIKQLEAELAQQAEAMNTVKQDNVLLKQKLQNGGTGTGKVQGAAGRTGVKQASATGVNLQRVMELRSQMSQSRIKPGKK